MVAFSRFSLEPEGVSHDYPTCLQHISLWVAAMLISSLTRFAFGFHLRPLFGHGGTRLPPHCMTPSPARLCFVHKKGHGRRVQFVAAKLLTALLPPPSLKVLVLGHGRFAPHVSMSLMLMSCADVPASVSRGRMLRPGDCSRCNPSSDIFAIANPHLHSSFACNPCKKAQTKSFKGRATTTTGQTSLQICVCKCFPVQCASAAQSNNYGFQVCTKNRNCLS